MAPHRNARRSRRLSRRSPMSIADYTWDNFDLQTPHTTTDTTTDTLPIAILPPVTFPPSPSTCTSHSVKSPSPIVTHLPFTPGSSHSRNRKKGHIPRPPNAFMIFRSWLWNKDDFKSVERDNRNVSRIAGRYWNELTDEERVPFRRMAEEAKARHAQLYPEYKYAPVFRKTTKATQRRSKRTSEDENARCKKVAELLIDGVKSEELAKHLDEESDDEYEDSAGEVRGRTTIKLPTVSMQGPRPRPATSRKKQAPASKKARPTVPAFTPTPAYSPASAATPAFYTPELKREDESTPMLLARTPQLVYPPDELDEFVAIGDIPYLSLDDCCDETPSTSADLYALPSNAFPAANTALYGVKQEAIPFVDECMLSAWNAYSSVPSTPSAIQADPSSTDSFQWSSPTPDSPVMFSDPFKNKGGSNPLLETLDQLFDQSISPLTPVLPPGIHW